MSGPPPPQIPQDGHTALHHLPHPVNANDAPFQQYQFQTDAPQPYYTQQQSSRHYTDDQWSSPYVHYPQFDTPSNAHQQLLQTATTAVDPRYAAPTHFRTPQYISQPQQSMQPYPAYGFQGQLPQSNWQGPPYSQQQMSHPGIPQMDNAPPNFPYRVPQQFLGASDYAMVPGGDTSTEARIGRQDLYGGLSAKAAGKRKAVDDDDDDDDSRFGEPSSQTVKRARYNAGNQQMYMPPPPVPYPGFNATGRTRMTSAAAGLSGGQSFMMTGMQFNAGDQFEASGAQSSQYMSLPQNRGSTSFSQVPQGYYNQNGALPQAWNVPYGTNGSSQIVHPYSQDPSVVDRYRDRGQHKLAFNNRPTGSMTARLLWRQSLLKYVHRAGGKMNPYHRWFIANGSEIMLLVSLHTQRPGALYSTGAVSTHVPSFTLREVLNEDEKRVVYRRVLTILATVLAKHERTVASNHSMGGVSYMQNGSNGFQRSADNFAGPSRHSLPTPARTPVQPDAAIHAPAPAPVITAENTGTVGTLPVNNASPTPLAQPESPGIRNEDSGEDGPELPPCPTSPIDRPPTPLVDENPADTADNQVKTEEQKSGGTSERPHSAVITDMPWFKEHFASVHQEQRVASTSTTSAGDHCTTDDDGAADDLEYDCVFNEFMVNDEDEDENADDKCLFGSPLLSQKDADEDGSSSLPKEDADDAEFKGLS